jgi:hypothetical protein
MTIRDLIEQGAGLDDEIDVEAKVYDADGRSCGTFISYDSIPFDSFGIVPGRITIKVDIEPV